MNEFCERIATYIYRKGAQLLMKFSRFDEIKRRAERLHKRQKNPAIDRDVMEFH